MLPYTKEGLALDEGDGDEIFPALWLCLDSQFFSWDIPHVGRCNGHAESVVVQPSNYYEYELVGVLVHTGSADMGHYYSFIKVL